MMIYGIDFDGTIVEEKYPAIGEGVEKVISFIRNLKERGDKWILITMREGESLAEAVEWLTARGIAPDAVNDNLPERIALWGNNPRKVYADIYIDDHNAGGVQLPGMETNGDVVRAMTDEKLASWRFKSQSAAGKVGWCRKYWQNPLPCRTWLSCRACVLAWLKAPAGKHQQIKEEK